MILKNHSKNFTNSDAQNSQRTSLHALARFIVAIILQLGFIVYFTIGGGGLGTGLGFSDTAKTFLFIFIPTITILFLLPVIIRGSRSQKIVAVILLLFPAWIAFLGWKEIINQT
jgi:hypothetical protein